MRTLLPLALLVVAGCAGEPSAPARAPTVPGPPAEVRPGAPLDRILGPHDDLGAFLERLAAPRRQAAEPVANRHDPAQVDTVRTLVYDGLVLEVYDITGGGPALQRVTVTGSRYGTASGLAVGEARADLEAVLGPAVREEGGVVFYETGGGPTPTSVEVTYERDADGVARASAIAWAPYLD